MRCFVDFKFGKLGPAQRAADQQSQDYVVAFALQRGAVGDRQKLFRLLAGEPVPQPSSLLPNIRHVRQIGGLFDPDQSQAPGFADQLADRRQPDINRGSGKPIQRSPVLEQQRPGEWTAGREGEQVVERFPVVAPRVRRGQGIEHQGTQPLLGEEQVSTALLPVLFPQSSRNELCSF